MSTKIVSVKLPPVTIFKEVQIAAKEDTLLVEEHRVKMFTYHSSQ